MSDAGDDIQVDDGAAQPEVVAEPPKGKMNVEEALQVRRSTAAVARGTDD
jgi:hypothetical protein